MALVHNMGTIGDLTGGVRGMGRTDSEQAFQEFLKRIPSSSNLAAIAGSTGQLSWGRGDLGGALDLLPSSSALLPSIPPLPGNHVEGSGATAPGMPGLNSMPRVTSMDFLARLVGQGQPNMHSLRPPAPAPAHTKMEPIMHMAPGPLALHCSSGPLMGLGPTSDLASMSLQMPASLVGINPLASHHAALAATAAAAIQLQGQLSRQQAHIAHTQLPSMSAHQHQNLHNQRAATSSHHHRATSSHANTDSSRSDDDDDKGNPTDRKARRMLSNRESARRSRKRKQEHLSKLEGELGDMEREKNRCMDHAAGLERRSHTSEEENRRLRDENDRLRDELRFLREQLSERKADRNGWRGSDRQQPEAEEGTQAGKRTRLEGGSDSGRHEMH